jgi:hypothetical protein
MPRADKLQESDLLKLKLLIPRENHDSAEEIDPWQNCWRGGAIFPSTVRNLQLSRAEELLSSGPRPMTYTYQGVASVV